MKRSLHLIAAIWLLISGAAPAIIDTNENGLSDLWEKAHNNNELFPATYDPEADSDQDGWTNAEEAAAGTDPANPNPPDGLVHPDTAHIPATYHDPDEDGFPDILTPETITLTWPTIPGKKYTLLVSTDLAPESWLPCGQDASFIGNGNQVTYGFPTAPYGRRFWRIKVEDADTDVDGLSDAEELQIGSSRYLPDTDGDGMSDSEAFALGKNPAGDGTDADGDGIPDNELYSVQFEIQDESNEMPGIVGFEVLDGTRSSKRYLTRETSETYTITNSPRYVNTTNSKHRINSTFLSGTSITEDGQNVTSESGITSAAWKNDHRIQLGENEYLLLETTPPIVAGPTITATEISTITTETTTWQVMKDNSILRSGVETITVTDRTALSSEVAYPHFWSTYVKQRPWREIHAPLKYGPIYSVGSGNISETAKANRENFKNGNFTVSGVISTVGRSDIDCGAGTKLKYLRWRWIRFNPNDPFAYEYAAPPASYQQRFYFIVQQYDRFGNRHPYLPLLSTEEHSLKGVVEVNCSGSEGQSDWQTVPMAKFDIFKIDDPSNLASMDFTTWCGSYVTFGTRVNMDFIKPGTEDDEPPLTIANDKEDSEGEVVNINWDDDNNSEGNGGHAKLVFKNDFDEAGANPKEDDMIQLKIPSINFAPGIPAAKVRLKYDTTFLQIWRNKDRSDFVASEQTEIELAGDQIVYLEGKKLTEAEAPKEIVMQLKLGSTGYAAGDSIKVHVATPIITFGGKHDWTGGAGSRNLADQLRSKDHLGTHRRDDRNNTVILRGKNQEGKRLWYSIDIIDLIPYSSGHPVTDKPMIQVISPNLDKDMKMALSLQDCHIFYDGHSNFGLGPNFVQNPTILDDYMNISGRNMTTIDYEELITDHGDPNITLREADYVASATNSIVAGVGQLKFSGPANGAVLTKKNGMPVPGHPYHFTRSSTGNPSVTNYEVIVHSQGDLPVLRYKSCFMASCNTGRHFHEVLTHGTLLFSMAETFGTIGADGQIDGDLLTLHGSFSPNTPSGELGESWGITHYVKHLINGESWDSIVKFFNDNQTADENGNTTSDLFRHN